MNMYLIGQHHVPACCMDVGHLGAQTFSGDLIVLLNIDAWLVIIALQIFAEEVSV